VIFENGERPLEFLDPTGLAIDYSELVSTYTYGSRADQAALNKELAADNGVGGGSGSGGPPSEPEYCTEPTYGPQGVTGYITYEKKKSLTESTDNAGGEAAGSKLSLYDYQIQGRATTKDPEQPSEPSSGGEPSATSPKSYPEVAAPDYNIMNLPRQSELQYPIKMPGILTSASGEYDYYLGGNYTRKPHLGAIDIRAKIGTPVYVIANGRVTGIFRNHPSWGNSIIVQHENGLVTRYSHLNDIYVAKNQMVEKENAIGIVGNTGRSTGPHLDFRSYLYGVPIDPVFLLGPLPSNIIPGLSRGNVKPDGSTYANWLNKEE